MLDTVRQIFSRADQAIHQCKRMLLGGHASQPSGINLLVALAFHLFLSVILWTGVAVGRIGAVPAWCLTAYIYVGMAALYVPWRSGLALNGKQSAFTFLLVLHNLGAILLAYALIEESRPQAMQYLCLLLVFGLLQLGRRQIYTVVAIPTMGLIGIVAYNLWHFPDRHHLAEEFINVGMGSLIMPTMVYVSAFARRLRVKLQKQKAELAETLAKMELMSVRDALTGVYTRRHLQSLAEAECLRSKRTQQPFCVVLLDIDHFKRVNDTFGHAVGDAVLIDFAQQVENAVGKHKALGRWGGEEFLLLMPETDLNKAKDVMSRVQQLVRGHDWSRHAQGLTVTFSAGIRQHALLERLADTIAAADEALYQAKARGRDEVRASTREAIAP